MDWPQKPEFLFGFPTREKTRPLIPVRTDSHYAYLGILFTFTHVILALMINTKTVRLFNYIRPIYPAKIVVKSYALAVNPTFVLAQEPTSKYLLPIQQRQKLKIIWRENPKML